jgi:hypothetical protein
MTEDNRITKNESKKLLKSFTNIDEIISMRVDLNTPHAVKAIYNLGLQKEQLKLMYYNELGAMISFVGQTKNTIMETCLRYMTTIKRDYYTHIISYYRKKGVFIYYRTQNAPTNS